ncbi:MAG TPA: SUMF1/EgtB/PvdO family nonheme iron enzyme [Verrucomicrobiae bacterium]|jgi:formylglycine-generating enzyme required for sulfatase activity
MKCLALKVWLLILILAAGTSLAQTADSLKGVWSLASGRGHALTNSLGMKFVPVPGTAVSFSVWDTRVQDYQAFTDTTSRKWEKPTLAEGQDHPAVRISWMDAQDFCGWLTEKEQKEGRLKSNERYRLPTDAEWSMAADLGMESGTTPEEKSLQTTNQYPWGQKWPPSSNAGNYDASLHVDSFERTSPVGSFAANQFGLFDMGGNVWQWCENEYSPGDGFRVLRGAAWDSYNSWWKVQTPLEEVLLSSSRNIREPASFATIIGFRVVLAGK